MSRNSDNVVEFPNRRGGFPGLRYTKADSDRLVGRTFVTTLPEDTRVGLIVGAYAHRKEGRLATYGLKTECRSLEDGSPVCEGTLGKMDLERGRSFVVPKGDVSRGIEEFLKTTEGPSQSLLEGIHVEVYAAKHMRAYSEGIIL